MLHFFALEKNNIFSICSAHNVAHYFFDKHLGVSLPGVPAMPEDSVH